MAAPRGSSNLLAAGVLALVIAPAATDDTETTAADTGDDFSIVDELAQLPVSALGEQPMIFVADLDAASELNGLERPPADDPELRVWMGRLAGVSEPGAEFPPVFVPFPPLLQEQYDPVEFRAAAGWSVADVATVAATSSPPTGLTVVSGDFDESTLPDDYIELSDGVVTDLEGEDFRTTMEPTPLSRIGVPQRLAVRDGRLAVSPSTPVVEAWLSRDVETAADDATLNAVATALDDAGAVTAVLGPMTAGPGFMGDPRMTPAQLEALLAELADVALTTPFDAVGLGWGADDAGDAELTLAYHFADEAAADAAAERLPTLFADGSSLITRTAMSDLLVLDEIEVDGDVAIAHLRPADDSRPQALFDMFVRRDLPFVVIG